MDIGIDMECLKCGIHFSHCFRTIPHGRVVRCPFCFSTKLDVKREMALEGRSVRDYYGRSMRFRFTRAKGEQGK